MTWRILTGDCRDVLATLPGQHFHCVVTSPPYYALRDYQTDGQIGLEQTPEQYVAALVEVFRSVRRVLRDDGVFWLNLGDRYAASGKGGGADGSKQRTNVGALIPAHGNRVGTEGFQQGDLLGIPWRVAFALQADGWILRGEAIWAKPAPMPESINGTRWTRCRVQVAHGEVGRQADEGGSGREPHGASISHKTGRGREPQKSATGKPQQDHARGAAHSEFAPSAQWEDCPGCAKCAPNDGLVLRRGAWRPTRAHEFVFQFVKSMDYFSDAQAVAEPAHSVVIRSGGLGKRGGTDRNDAHDGTGGNTAFSEDATRNPRSVWTIAPKPFTAAGLGVDVEHYACFPPELPERCIRASTSERGCCARCGAQVARVLGERQPAEGRGSGNGFDREWRLSVGGRGDATPWKPTTTTATGWRPTCTCAAPAVPCRVLDPFSGAGTTGMVAARLGRDYVGVEINPQYVELSRRRIGGDAPLFNVSAERT